MKLRNQYRTQILFVIASVVIELVGVYVLDGSMRIQQPLLAISCLILSLSLLNSIRSPKAAYILGMILLIIQATINIAQIILYDMTGTYFDYGMLHLRNDAFGFIESLPVDYLSFFICSLCIIYYIVYGRRGLKYQRIYKSAVRLRTGIFGILFSSVVLAAVITSRNNASEIEIYHNRLYESGGSRIRQLGGTANLINEMAKGLFFQNRIYLSDEEITEFIYEYQSSPTTKFGASKGKNVVIILAESFEWFPFIQEDFYKNQIKLTEEEIMYLFPNLYHFYQESVVLSNFHAREKTDISEALSILGNYPTDVYVNYDYPENSFPFSLPNRFREDSGNKVSVKSFHNGFASFYNREIVHKSFGFEYLMDSYGMYELSDKQLENGGHKESSMHDYMSEGERNLDSEMMMTAKELMFPTDQKFFTYITTITMHGLYYRRENLEEYYDKLSEVVDIEKLSSREQIVAYYMTACMDLDVAIGIMLEDLKEKDLLDETLIVLFSDHNAYYQGLSGYVKNIDERNKKEDYPRLYQVPCMIYDTSIEHQMIDKFTCTADLVPTVLDLLGLSYYENLCYGNSVFSEEESLLYSRAYHNFLNDKLIFRSFQDVIYKSKELSADELLRIENKTIKLYDKIQVMDSVYALDYFERHPLRVIKE